MDTMLDNFDYEIEREDAELWDEERRLEILARLIMKAEQGELQTEPS